MEYNQQDIEHVLLRRLEVGDRFKVANKLVFNYNENMEESQGKWLTIISITENTNRLTKDPSDRFNTDPKEFVDYMSDKLNSCGNHDHWHEYHMNITDTNEWISKKDRWLCRLGLES